MEIAALSFKLDSSSVVAAANDLDRFAASAAKAGASANIPVGSIAKLVATVQSMNTKLSAIVGGLDRVNAALSSNAKAAQGAAVANDNVARSIGVADSHVIAYTQHLAGLVATSKAAATAQVSASNDAGAAARSFANADAHVQSYVNNLRMLAQANKSGTVPPPSHNPAGPSSTSAIGAQAAATSDLTKRTDDLLIAVFPLSAAQARVNAMMNEAADLYKKGALSENEYAGVQVTLARQADALTAKLLKQNGVIADTEGVSRRSSGALSQLLQNILQFVPGSAGLMNTVQVLGNIRDISGEAGGAANVSTGAFRAMATALGVALLPFLPLIAAAGLLAAGLAAITHQANDDSGLKKYTAGMGYTKAEVEKLNDVTVTFGDTTKAVFQVALNSAAEAMGFSAKNMAKTWDSFLDHIASGTRATLAGVYAGLAGTRAYLGEIEKGGVLGLGKALIGQGDPDLLKKTYGKAYADGQKALDAITKQARTNALARQDKMAKEFYDKPREKREKQDPLTGILREAQAEIETEKTRAAAVGLSARAAAEMEQRTKILNQIQKAGIPITDSLRGKVDALAKAYADAKIAAESAAAVQGVIDGYQKQNDAINDQLSLVGSYGDALTKARIEAEALAAAQNALPKGETLSSAQSTQVLDATRPVIRDQINLDLATRTEKIRKDAEDSAYALDLERKGLGLTGAAAEAYAFSTSKLNEYKQQGITLSADEIANLNAVAKAYGEQRYAIDQQAKALADAREVTKGFFSDWINGVRDGQNLFKAFADSVVNSLNRIIDKLLDKTLEGFLDSMFKNGAGSFLDGLFGKKAAAGVPTVQTATVNALGGVYGTPQRFANGGAFTNTIVNTPTLFRFANGGALGEMGEAGPEAIIPLKRGPNGSLGVQMHGGGKPSIRMGDVHNTYQVSGALDQSQIVAMVRQGGEATYNQMKRDLESLLQQLQTDGAFASS